MRVTNVELYSADFEEAINFSLDECEPAAQYMVRTIVGLDAEEIIPKFYGFGSVSKSKYYDFSLKPRDIVIRVVLSPRYNLDETVSDIRDELYRAISATRTGLVSLHFKSGASVISRILGSIIKFEVPYFVKLPEVQLTVRCNDPMFRGISPVQFVAADLGTSTTVLVPDSISTAPHGFTMQLTFNATSPSFTIQDAATTPDWIFKIVPNGGFLSGDVLNISTEFAAKSVNMVRSGVTTQLADKIDPTSIWPTIFPGQNSFFFVDKAKFNWNSLQYYAAYWGV